jgi:glycosyltransferase involved in cell wall biosynthesis
MHLFCRRLSCFLHSIFPSVFSRLKDLGPSLIAVNARFRSHRQAGMQRYAAELVRRFGDAATLIVPSSPLRGVQGHLWEQTVLPLRAGKRLLWSPNNTGPLSIEHQVCTIHDLIPLDHPEWFTPQFVRMNRILLNLLTHKVRHIIAISQHTKQRILELLRVPDNKVTVVPNGVDPAFAAVSSQDTATHLSNYFLSEDRYILCVGSLEPRKNLSRLLQAWDLVRERLPEDFELVIAGGAGSKNVFAEEVKTPIPPKARFLGYVPEEALPALYAGAAAFVYPSLSEGFGLPPLEAMAAGTPVITSATSAIPETAAGAALLVDPRSPYEVGSAIHKLVESPILREAMRKAGRIRAQQFSWDKCSSTTLQLLERYA